MHMNTREKVKICVSSILTFLIKLEVPGIWLNPVGGKKKDLAAWTHSQGASSRGRWLLTLEGVCILQCTFPSILHELITWPSQANALYTLFLPFPVIECYICLSSLIGFTLSLFLFSLPNLHPFTPKPQTPKTREHRVNPKPETPIKTINITILRRPIHHLSAKLSLTVPLINNFFFLLKRKVRPQKAVTLSVFNFASLSHCCCCKYHAFLYSRGCSSHMTLAKDDHYVCLRLHTTMETLLKVYLLNKPDQFALK